MARNGRANVARRCLLPGMNGLGLDAARGPVIAPKTSMAGASRDAGYLLRFRMASASGRPEYSPLPWAARRRWIPVPLPPPARATLCFLRMNSRAIKPSNGGDISYELRTPVPQSGPLFSERPVSLRSYGLHPFGTVLEIRTLGATYEFQRKEVLSIFSDRREPLISKLAISL